MHLKMSSAKWRLFLSRPQCVNELKLSSWYNIKIQILILPYVNTYVIWALMGWTLWWSDYGWWSVLMTNMYILMAWCRAVAAPVCYQWSCCDLALGCRSVDISTRTFIHIRICFFMYTAHKKFMNTSTSAESMASFILEGRYLENQTP